MLAVFETQIHKHYCQITKQTVLYNLYSNNTITSAIIVWIYNITVQQTLKAGRDKQEMATQSCPKQ